MELRGWIPAIFTRRKDDEKASGFEGHRRQSPFRKLRLIIGEKPAIQVHRGIIGVVNLNPVREVAIFIRKTGSIIRHKLGNQWASVQDR